MFASDGFTKKSQALGPKLSDGSALCIWVSGILALIAKPSSLVKENDVSVTFINLVL